MASKHNGTMAGSLEDPRLKFDHGTAHLTTLRSMVADYLRSNPYRITSSADVSPGEHILWLEVVQPPPPEISLTLGDCLHDFRSALDHLMWQLVLATGGQPTASTQFPIFWSRRLFSSRAQKMTRALTNPAALNFVEAQQPFATTLDKVDPLWYLHELSNRDKHQLLQVTALYIDYFPLGTYWKMPNDGLRIDYGPFGFGRQVLAHVPFEVAARSERVSVEPRMTIVLEDARMHRDLVSRLDTIKARVEGVLQDAGQFF